MDSKWWPDRELGRAFRRWTSIPPASGAPAQKAAVRFLVERLKVSGLNAVGTAPRTPLQRTVAPDAIERIRTMVARLGQHGPNEEAPDQQALIDIGEPSLEVLVAQFPGRLWFNRWEPHVRPPKGRNVSALCRTLVAFGEHATPFVARLLGADDEEVRYYAVLVAAELPYAGLVEPIAEALFDDDPGVSRGALYALESFGAVDDMDGVKESLRSLAASPDADQRSRLLAMRALAVLRDTRCFATLVSSLSERSVLGEAAWRVLRMLTAQDFGTDVSAWTRWWELHGDESRTEWLIDSLDHPERDVREIVARDLVDESGAGFGYDPDLPPQERQAVRERFRLWWSERALSDQPSS